MRKYIDRYDILHEFFLSVLYSSSWYAIHTLSTVDWCDVPIVINSYVLPLVFYVPYNWYALPNAMLYEADHKLTNETTFIKDDRKI